MNYASLVNEKGSKFIERELYENIIFDVIEYV